MTLYIHGLGHHHPENEIDNRFLENPIKGDRTAGLTLIDFTDYQ